MNPSDKRKSEYRKMKAAFEWNDWPVPTPQSFHHWTLARQVDHLITAREAEPDLGFMVRLMALCSLPRTNPGRRIQYKRVNGPLHPHYDGDGQRQTPLWEPAPVAHGLGLDGSRADPAPRADPGSITLGVHAQAGHLPAPAAAPGEIGPGSVTR